MAFTEKQAREHKPDPLLLVDRLDLSYMQPEHIKIINDRETQFLDSILDYSVKSSHKGMHMPMVDAMRAYHSHIDKTIMGPGNGNLNVNEIIREIDQAYMEAIKYVPEGIQLKPIQPINLN